MLYILRNPASNYWQDYFHQSSFYWMETYFHPCIQVDFHLLFESFSGYIANSLIQQAKNIFFKMTCLFVWNKSWICLFHKYIFCFALICKRRKFLVEKNSPTKIFVHSVTAYIWDLFIQCTASVVYLDMPTCF